MHRLYLIGLNSASTLVSARKTLVQSSIYSGEAGTSLRRIGILGFEISMDEDGTMSLMLLTETLDGAD